MTNGLGELQQLILLALLRLGDDAYGARIQETLLESTGRDVAISTIYVTLVRMEDRGLVVSTPADHAAGGGPRRRCFAPTDAGRDRLRTSRLAANAMWTGLEDEILGGRT